jgi:hypothetical protein
MVARRNNVVMMPHPELRVHRLYFATSVFDLGWFDLTWPLNER